MTDKGPEAGVYVRLGSSTRQADSALVAELERNARGMAFEDLPEPRSTLKDLDLKDLSDLRGRETKVDDLLALGLAVRQGSDIVPTNAGILAACDDPTRFLPSAWVQCGRLRGPNGTDIFDQTEIYGPMPRAVGRVMEFLLKHAYKTAVFGEVRRRDTYSIPVEAIREIVVNALAHANYAGQGTLIRVGFYDDRI
jgi:predicted HTH transcriptional regulator